MPPTLHETVKGPQGPKTDGKDPNLVTWAGADDPANPKNWSNGYKWFLLSVCVVMTIDMYVN
jgi:hypothetical protein